MCLGYVGEGDVIVPDAAQAGQDLRERCYDQVFAVPEHKQIYINPTEHLTITKVMIVFHNIRNTDRVIKLVLNVIFPVKIKLT